jgi:hypothetical protein
MGRAIQPNAGPVGDAPRRSADDARQRRHGACAPYRVCKECRHQVEPDPAAMADRYGGATTVPEWHERKSLVVFMK